MAITVLVSSIGGIAALAGALGSQFIAARASLKARRLELFFEAKLQGYEALLAQIGEFAIDPKDLAKYLLFLAAYERALLVGSEAVREKLSGHAGISVNAQHLRLAQSEDERRRIAMTKWYDAAQAASSAMRQDLKRFSGGLQ